MPDTRYTLKAVAVWLVFGTESTWSGDVNCQNADSFAIICLLLPKATT